MVVLFFLIITVVHIFKGITTGKIVDYGITDANNMGAAMAPAAADLILNNFQDFNLQQITMI